MVTVVGSCLLVDIVASMAGYGFAKKPIPGKETLFQGYLATMMIPGQVTLIPMFLMINALGWTNTYRALILPMVGAFGIFLMRQFMEGLPNELLEAAEIDGCGEVRRFVTIVLPLVQPALITLTIFTFNGAWNNFLWPLIINTRSSIERFDDYDGDAEQQPNHQLWHGHGRRDADLRFPVPALRFPAKAVCRGRCNGRRQGLKSKELLYRAFRVLRIRSQGEERGGGRGCAAAFFQKYEAADGGKTWLICR